MTHLRWNLRLLAMAAWMVVSMPVVWGQGNAFIPLLNDPGGGNLFPGFNGGGLGPGSNALPGQQGMNQPGQGGAQNADFDSLMDLIISTVAPDSWVENGGAAAEIRPFPNGVWVDASGVLREHRAAAKAKLTSLSAPPVPKALESTNPHTAAKLRCVSLPRLEATIYGRMVDHQPLDESMLVLAGLQRIEYVFVYPELGDVVIAGPAGDWQLDAENRLVSVEHGTPVVRLDDLLTLLRRERSENHKPFGCSITPRQESLAATQAFLARTSATPLKPGRKAREAWLDELRRTLGRQDIEVFGINPGTHAAHVLVKADHHMKQVGIGLADGVAGVESYLDNAARAKESSALNVLRWWFSTNYTGVSQNESGTAFELMGQGVAVLSENELLTKRGERVHTGKSDEATQVFAHQFTAEFAALAAKYPVYGELRNLFDMALVAALLDSGDVYATANWQPVLFLDAKHLPLPAYRAPKEVDTILNHRLIDETRILAAVSGGVWIDSAGVLQQQAEPSAKLDYHRERMPQEIAAGEWWWDLE